MSAQLHSARLTPKKANLVAATVRGMPVPAALDLLSHTTKKAARIIEGVLHSAASNAEHNFKQDPSAMMVKTIVVNQGTAYRRGIPMARGRTRPIRKFLSHISITLGYSDGKDAVERKQRKQKMKRMEKNTRNQSGKLSSVS